MLQSQLQAWFESGDAAGFDALAAQYPLPELIHALMALYPGYPEQGILSERLALSRSLRPAPRPVRTVGTFYYRAHTGGAEHVISRLAAMWTAAGYRVVLFTDFPPDPADYPLPEGVVRYVLPDTFKLTPETRQARFDQFRTALEESGVDVFVHHAWLSFNLFWDLLAVRSLGIPFVEYIHGAFSCQLVEGRIHEMDQLYHLTRILKSADAVISLSHAFNHFWSRFNPRTELFLDPCDFKDPPDPAIRRKPDQLVWVGRIAPEKQPAEAVRILAEVRKTLPGVRLKIVGGTDDAFRPIEEALREEIRKLGLQDAVSLEGFHPDIARYYQEASLLLMTSAHEGFGLVIAEAKYYGLPCVAYDMPYNYFAEDARGYVSVPMNQPKAAAEAIVRLLTDPEAYSAAAEEAKKSASAFSADTLTVQWDRFLKKFELPETFADPVFPRSPDTAVPAALLSDAHLGFEKLQRQADMWQQDARGGFLSSVFDAQFYAARYPDLRAAFGTDKVSLLNHFLTFGMNEGRQACEQFNPAAYRERYPDLRAAFGDNVRLYYLHYLLQGRLEGRQGS